MTRYTMSILAQIIGGAASLRLFACMVLLLIVGFQASAQTCSCMTSDPVLNPPCFSASINPTWPHQSSMCLDCAFGEWGGGNSPITDPLHPFLCSTTLCELFKMSQDCPDPPENLRSLACALLSVGITAPCSCADLMQWYVSEYEECFPGETPDMDELLDVLECCVTFTPPGMCTDFVDMNGDPKLPTSCPPSFACSTMIDYVLDVMYCQSTNDPVMTPDPIDIACEYLKWLTDPNECDLTIDCDDILACLTDIEDELLGRTVTHREIQDLLQCVKTANGSCWTEFCDTDLADPRNDMACDQDGDGLVTCTDLAILIARKEACLNAQLSSEDRLILICDFLDNVIQDENCAGMPPPTVSDELQCENLLYCVTEAMGGPLTCDEAVYFYSSGCTNCLLDEFCNGAFLDLSAIRCDLTGDGWVDGDDICVFAELTRRCYENHNQATIPDDTLFDQLCLFANDSDCRWQIYVRLESLYPGHGVEHFCPDMASWFGDALGYGLTDEQLGDLYADDCADCTMLPTGEWEPNLNTQEDDLEEHCQKTSGEAGASDSPIHTAYGHKLESNVDLVVAMTGPNLVIRREYSSTTEYDDLTPNDQNDTNVFGLVGKHWSLTSFRRMNVGSILSVWGAPADRQVNYWKPDDDEPNEFSTGGSGNQFARAADDTIDIEYVDGTTNTFTVASLCEPGQWTQYFHDDPDAAELALATPGSLLMEEDVYGNKRVYRYFNYGTANDPVFRLRRIILNADHIDDTAYAVNEAEGYVEFYWILDGENAGRLRSIAVFRPMNDGGNVAWIKTQTVEYLYKAEIDADDYSDDLGTSGDLIQVITRTRVDASEGGAIAENWTRVTQYRYHDEAYVAPGTDQRLNVMGRDHQLKAVFRPEQIEFLAQIRSEEGSAPPALHEVIVLTARQLLRADDNADLNVTNGPDIVFDVASKIIGYDDTGVTDMQQNWVDDPRVKVQFIQTECGCAGGATQGVKKEYEYIDDYDWSAVGGYDPNPGLTLNIAEFLQSDLGAGQYETNAYRTTTYDHEFISRPNQAKSVPYIINYVISEGDGEGIGDLQWVTHYEYDRGDGTGAGVIGPMTLLCEFTPSITSSYSGPEADPNPPHDIQPPTWVGFSMAGLGHRYAYTEDNRVKEHEVFRGGNKLDASTVSETEYWTPSQVADEPNHRRLYLPKKIVRYNDDPITPGANDKEETSFVYWFYNDTDHPDSLAGIWQADERELQAENGPNAVDCVNSFQLFNTEGHLVWTVAPDDSMTYREFDPHTESVTLKIDNADPDDAAHTFNENDFAFNVFSNGDLENGCGVDLDVESLTWGDTSPDGELEWTFTYDLLGRITSSTTPAGVESYVIREMRLNSERPGVLYYANVTLPHKLSGTTEFNAPGVVTWLNASGNQIRRSEYTIDSAATYDPMALDYTLNETAVGEIARSAVDHRLSGIVDATRRWHDVGADGFYQTTFDYDNVGRVAWTKDAEGTYTHFEYDVLNRTTAVRKGLVNDPTSTDVALIRENYYDDPTHDLDEMTPQPEQGAGNGQLSWIIEYPGDDELLDTGTDSTRNTRHFYDFRDRLVVRENPLAPHQAYQYDNLDRLTRSAIFESLPTSFEPVDVIDQTTSRTSYTENSYSQRGLTYRSAVAINPANTSEGFLETHAWFDDKGRSIATWAPSSPAVKRSFDAHDRVTVEYITDRGGDAAPGATDTLGDASDVDGDTVFEQTEHDYNDIDQRYLTTQLMRVHDDTGTGALTGTDTGGSYDAVRTFTGAIYDDADRLIRSIDFGTNDTTTDAIFEAGGTAPTSLDPPPNPIPAPGYDTAPWKHTLISGLTYNERGIIKERIDSSGQVTLSVYDDLSRVIGTVEAQTNVEETDFSFGVAENRWLVNETLPANEDRVTTYTRDGLDRVVKLVAHIVGDNTTPEVQETDYIYSYQTIYGNTTIGDDATTTDTLVVTNNNLLRVIYPDGDNVNDNVTYAYNALGERRHMIDQRGIDHDYIRDHLGRVTSDTVSDFSNHSDIGSVAALTTTYDDSGRVDTITSDNNAGTVLNKVEYTYDSLWNVTTISQDVDGAGLIAAEDVTYTYARQKLADGNYNRVTKVTYPDATELNHAYAGTANDLISRLTNLEVDDPDQAPFTIVSYDGATAAAKGYLGLGTHAIVDYPEPDVQLDFTLAHDGLRSSDVNWDAQYPGWDHLGRTARQVWADGALADDAGSTLPTRPPLVEQTYTYDKASNRLTNVDARPKTVITDRDRVFSYDALHRVIQHDRGVISGTSIGTFAKGSQEWTLDILGNWTDHNTDLNGDGDWNDPFFDSYDVRVHNEANEVTDQDITSGGTASTRDITWDEAGNILDRELSSSTYEHVHDAWNRLIQVDLVTSGTTTIAKYEYYANHMRSIREFDRDIPYSGIDERRRLYYDSDWRLLEEHIDADLDGDVANDGDRIAQQFWGIRHIDDAVMRRHREADDTWAASHELGYYLTDVQFSTYAMISDAAMIIERIVYDAYGQGQHRWSADVDGDGDVDSQDATVISALNGVTITGGLYNVHADINHDGVINGADYFRYLLETGNSELVGQISDPDGIDNAVGFDGYLFDRETRYYRVRHRTYDPALGRWLQRDPAGYIDGLNLFLYALATPFRLLDPFGLNPPTFEESGLSATAYNAFYSVPVYDPVQGQPIWQVPLTNAQRAKQRMAEIESQAQRQAAEIMVDFYTDAMRTTAEMTVPGVGETVDAEVLLHPESKWWERALAATSLAGSVATAGVGPNLGPIMRQSDECVDLYRGVHKGHVKYDEAIEGLAQPTNPDGTTTPIEHNAGITQDSPYTSWTTNREFAEQIAASGGPGGVLLKTTLPLSQTVKSIDAYDEAEVLIKGPHRANHVTIMD